MKWFCKIIGHLFAGYEIPKDGKGNPLQVMPDKFFCARCKSVVPAVESTLKILGVIIVAVLAFVGGEDVVRLFLKAGTDSTPVISISQDLSSGGEYDPTGVGETE